jgi:hypothetical protein
MGMIYLTKQNEYTDENVNEYLKRMEDVGDAEFEDFKKLTKPGFEDMFKFYEMEKPTESDYKFLSILHTKMFVDIGKAFQYSLPAVSEDSFKDIILLFMKKYVKELYGNLSDQLAEKHNITEEKFFIIIQFAAGCILNRIIAAAQIDALREEDNDAPMMYF